MQISLFSSKFIDHQDQFDKFRSQLKSEELWRSEKFYFEKDRIKFIIGRGLLRSLLSEILKLCPNEIEISYNKKGKPYIAFPKEPRIFFNLSHSHERIIFAFCTENEVGIDIEYRKDLFDMDKIAENYFSKKEFSKFLDLPLYKKKEAFFNCWTRKEAFIKAIGEGLSIPLNSFDVTFLSEEKCQFLDIKNDLEEANKWSLINIQIDDNYSSALAVRGNVSKMNYLSFSNNKKYI